MKIAIQVETATSMSTRARQASAMFDAPPSETCRLSWDADLPIEDQPWNVGLVVGPSGSGKTTVMRHVWGEPAELRWGGPSVIDDVAEGISIDRIAETFGSVGFNTIPAWMRPFAVLSNGERFRADIARRLLELPDPVVVDEFTSVVDRQVAKVASHAIQRHVRKRGRKFVAVGCHYDVIDWLQPDWVLDMATCSFTRRSLQRRPSLECVAARIPFAAWSVFAPFHYLTSELHRSARTYGLWVDGRLAAFAGVLYRPHATSHGIYGVSRLVTLPDWQGLGLSPKLVALLGAAYAATGGRLRTYPAHPALIDAFQSDKGRESWRMVKDAGVRTGRASNSNSRAAGSITGAMGGRPCAVFEYCGPPMAEKEAQRLIAAA